ncbi:MAG TPA: SPW repeat protein [Acidiferrobacterales bacterium]|nr:SPW repeat protein [Acidiferrobacterales bacterium]
MQNINRLQDQIEIVIGLWLCISPWVLGYSGPLQVAGWSAILVGIGVLLFSFEDLALPSEIEEWVELVLGLALMASPWVWNYSDNMPATLNALISGFLVTGVAFWALKHLGFPGIGSEQNRPKPH